MLQLRGKVLAGLGGILATLLAVCFLCNLVVRRYSARIELLLDQDYQSAVACQSMKESLEGLLDLARRSVVNEEPVTEQQVQHAVDDFNRSLSRQMAATDAPGEQEATVKLADMWRSFTARYQELFDTSKSNAARLDLFRQQVVPQAHDLRAQAQQIIDINLLFLDSGRANARLAAIHAQWIVFAVAMTTIAVAACIAVLCGTFILRPVNLLTRSVNEIAAGNLDLSVNVRSHDEIGQLAAAFNEMAGQLRHFKRIDQDRLLRTQRTTQLAIDTLPDAMVILDPDGTIDLANRTAARLFDLAPGQTARDSKLSWLADLHRRALGAGERSGDSDFRSAIKINDRGETRYFLPRTYPIRDDARDQTIGVAILLADITDFRRLDEMKNDLLSTVAHELKTPLTSMRMITHLLSEQLSNTVSPRQRELLDANLQDTDRLDQLVQDLLDIGRLESGRAALDCRAISVAQLARAGVEPMRQALESSGLMLVSEIVDGDALVRADQARICQVFANLLANALKYTGAGGRVTISARQQDSEIHFSVADTGKGIPRSYLPRVFEKFFRVPGQPGGSGSGLGLTIVKDIIGAHGGRIEVDSREGAGTTISFTLPRADVSDAHVRTSEVNYAHN